MIDIKNLDMELVLANSYRDFHAKGLHYICLRRNAEITDKLYFFEGQTSKLGEVINPHDHRYDFTTTCLAGAVRNHTYRRLHPSDYANRVYGTRFNRFEWRTPLNGGNGFTQVGYDVLLENDAKDYAPGQSYLSNAEEIHTITVRGGTVLKLRQYTDRHDISVPTNTYSRSDNMPLDDLYGTWTADQIVGQLRLLNDTYRR